MPCCYIHTKSKLSIILEQGISPSRTISFTIHTVWCCRCWTAPDGTASCSISYHHPVSEQLSDELHVRGLSASRTCSWKFKIRHVKLAALYAVFIEWCLFLWKLCCKLPVWSLIHLCINRLHNKSFFLWRTYLSAVSASSAVIWRNLDSEGHAVKSFSNSFLCFKTLRSIFHLFLTHKERPYCCMRTYIWALIALYAVIYVPFRNFNRYTPLLISWCALLPCSVFYSYKCRYRQSITLLGIHYFHYISYKCRIFLIFFWKIRCIFPWWRNFYFDYVIYTLVNSGVVHINNFFAFLSIGFHNSILHVFNCVFNRDYIGNFEECRHEYHICSTAKS